MGEVVLLFRTGLRLSLHLVCVHAALRISAWPKYAMSGVRLSRAV